jgi:hypothetical protein
MAKEIIKIMVSSAVYGFENQIEQICTVINSYSNSKYKYKVLNNHIGTVPPIPGLNNAQSCLRAVEDCDYFLGVILPRYGSGITHDEFNRAIELDKPRGYLSHYNIRIARDLLAQYMYVDIKKREKNPAFIYNPSPALQDVRVIDMYNEAIRDGEPLEDRKWAQEFGHNNGDSLVFIDALFGDIKRFKTDLDNTKNE